MFLIRRLLFKSAAKSASFRIKMSVNFAGIPVKSYAGDVVKTSMQINNGNCVPLFLDWAATYGGSTAIPNLGVSVSLLQGNVQALSKVISVYIDNDNSFCPIYVVTSEGFTVSAAPNTSGWQLLITNSYQFTIYATGMVTGSIPQTKVYFADIFIPSNVDPALNLNVTNYIGSPLSLRFGLGAPPYSPPALGDQITQTSISLTSVVPTNMNIPQIANNFVYITQVQFLLVSILATTNNIAQVFVDMFNNIDADNLITKQVTGLINSTPSVPLGNVVITDIKGNYRFPANRQWQLVADTPTNVASGSIIASVVFSVGPN